MAASDGVEFNAGPVKVALRQHAPHVVRVSLGARTSGAPSSYLNGQPDDKLPAMEIGASPVSLRLGELTVEIDPAAKELIFSDSSGRRQMRLATDRLALAPRVRLLLGTVGEQHFYGLGEDMTDTTTTMFITSKPCQTHKRTLTESDVTSMSGLYATAPPSSQTPSAAASCSISRTRANDFSGLIFFSVAIFGLEHAQQVG